MTTMQEIAKFLLGAGIGANLGDEDDERIVGALIGAGLTQMSANRLRHFIQRLRRPVSPAFHLPVSIPSIWQQSLGNERGAVNLGFNIEIAQAFLAAGIRATTVDEAEDRVRNALLAVGFTDILGNECGVVDLFGNRVPEASTTPGPETGRWDMMGKGETWQLCPRRLYVSISRACVVCKVCSSGKDRKRVRTLRTLARQTPAPSGCSQSENLPMPYKDPTVQRRYQTQWRAAKRQPPPQERPQIWTGQTLTWQ
jgi:hypothetical protein